MNYEWKPFHSKNERAYMSLMRDGQVVFSIVETPTGWQSLLSLDDPRWLPGGIAELPAPDRAEVLRKLVELNEEM